ncbi:PRC-barrel domain-containing protein [Pseudochelatococcus sp. B33]
MRNIMMGSLMLSAVALAAPAFAQEAAPTPETPAAPETPTAPETPAAPAAPETPVTPPTAEPPAAGETPATPANPPAVVSISDTNVLSSNLVGLNVSNAGNETVGSIRDLVLDSDNSLTGIIVSVGGFLGLGEHYVVLEPESVTVTYNETDRRWDARVNATAEDLKAAPAFKYEGKFGN